MSKALLKDVCSKGSSSLRQKDVANDGPFPVIGASGVVGSSSTYQFDRPYLAVVKDGAGVGRVIRCQAKSSILGTMQAIMPGERVTLDYLQHLLRNMNLGNYASGATIPHIYFKDYGKAVISVPPLEEQEDISIRLNTPLDLIDSYRTQIAALDELVKSRFIEMFESGNDWELRTIAECCKTPEDIKCGPFGSQLHKEDYISEGVPVWGIPEVNSGFEKLPSKFVSPENAKRLQAYSLMPGDVAMTRKGNVGQAALFDGSQPSGIIHSDVLRVRVRRDILNPSFLVEQLHSSHVVREQVMSASTGAIMAGTNVTKLKNIKVFVPPLAIQQEFADFVAKVDKLGFAELVQVATEDSYHSFLLWKTLPGIAEFDQNPDKLNDGKAHRCGQPRPASANFGQSVADTLPNIAKTLPNAVFTG